MQPSSSTIVENYARRYEMPKGDIDWSKVAQRTRPQKDGLPVCVMCGGQFFKTKIKNKRWECRGCGLLRELKA